MDNSKRQQTDDDDSGMNGMRQRLRRLVPE